MGIWQEVRERVGVGALLVGAILLTLVVVYLVPENPELALALAGVVFVGVLALVHPVTLPLLAFPLSVIVARAGVAGIDMTVSDYAIGLAFWPALLFAPRPFSPALRQLLWLNAIYQALTLFTLLANPFAANTVEWFHAWLLVSGALVVGWAVGASGHARLGVTLLLIACLGLAAVTLAQGAVQFASGNFSAVYPRFPWPMHKNFIGMVLGFAALVVYANPPFLAWGRHVAMSTFGVFVAGVALAQSRQALVAVVVGLFVITLRSKGERKRWVLLLLTVIPSLYLVFTIVQDQIESENMHNSWFQRLTWYREAVDLWGQSPWVGHGLRYWTQEDAAGRFQPPNVLLEIGASAGVVGLIGFLVMIVGTLVVLWRLQPGAGTLALALVLARLAQAQFDIFWVGISVSVPFLIVGLCLGVADRRTTMPTTVERDLVIAR